MLPAAPVTLRRLALLLLIPALLNGCPSPTPEGSSPVDLAVDSTASEESLAAGTGVTLTARALDDAALDGVTYRWFQTYGRIVELSGADTPELSFTTPSLPSEQVLTFRLDVRFANGETRSAETQVRVAVDPLYGLGTGLDPNSTPDDSGDSFPHVIIKTSKGTIEVELNREAAPLTVNNFLRYTDDKFYDGTIFHRVVPDFVVQAGGYTADLEEKETRDPILNEADNGLSNRRGTIAMARQSNPDSARSQFYINLSDNTELDAGDGRAGYAVFGEVVSGMDVVDDIASVETAEEGGFQDVPVEDITITSIRRK